MLDFSSESTYHATIDSIKKYISCWLSVPPKRINSSLDRKSKMNPPIYSTVSDFLYDFSDFHPELIFFMVFPARCSFLYTSHFYLLYLGLKCFQAASFSIISFRKQILTGCSGLCYPLMADSMVHQPG